MRLKEKAVCVGTAICLVVSFTITSYASVGDTIQNNVSGTSLVDTPAITPSTTPSITASATPHATPSAAALDTSNEEVTQTPGLTPAPGTTPTPTPTPTLTPTPTPTPKPTPTPTDDESLWHCKQIPMTKAHQKLLWDYCKKRNLDYIDMLSLVYLESGFSERAANSRYKGYFQISSANAANIAKTLKIKNKPLDGAININMGTALFSWILLDKRVKNLKGDKKREVALSIYKLGTGGYDKHGISKSYVSKFYKKKSTVSSYFKKKK